MIPEPRMATRLMERFMLKSLGWFFGDADRVIDPVSVYRCKYTEKTKCYASILVKLSTKIPLGFTRGIKNINNLIT
jgi:hypothetical protein